MFAIEEDIAQAIAGALRAPLGLARGRAASSRIARPTSILIRITCAVDRSCAAASSRKRSPPSKAPSSATRTSRRLGPCLSQAYRSLLDYNGLARRPDVPLADAREFVQSALERGERCGPPCNRSRSAPRRRPRFACHDPGFPRSVGGRRTIFSRKAFSIDPNNPEALYRYGQTLNIVGRVADSLRIV